MHARGQHPKGGGRGSHDTTRPRCTLRHVRNDPIRQASNFDQKTCKHEENVRLCVIRRVHPAKNKNAPRPHPYPFPNKSNWKLGSSVLYSSININSNYSCISSCVTWISSILVDFLGKRRFVSCNFNISIVATKNKSQVPCGRVGPLFLDSKWFFGKILEKARYFTWNVKLRKNAETSQNLNQKISVCSQICPKLRYNRFWNEISKRKLRFFSKMWPFVDKCALNFCIDAYLSTKREWDLTKIINLCDSWW